MALAFPTSILETLQQTFYQEAKRLCKDAAQILKVPEKELSAQVLGKLPRNLLKLVDDDELPRVCPVLCQEGALYKRCRGPCLLGTGLCLQHQKACQPPEVPEGSLSLTRLAVDTPLWCCEATQQVYDSSGAIVGELLDGELILYVLEKET
jgi:hypothetical protein